LLDSPRPPPVRVACELRIEINRGIFVLLCSRRAKLAVVTTAITVGALLTLGEFPAAYAVPPKPVKPASPAPIPSRYIVTLTDKPIATYGGDVKGLGTTRPSKGARVNVTSGRAKRYRLTWRSSRRMRRRAWALGR
jgi:multidrug efflux pump subunit AcrA (membrane-fusion protein)